MKRHKTTIQACSTGKLSGRRQGMERVYYILFKRMEKSMRKR